MTASIQVQPPIPPKVELNIPGGTYTATQTFVAVDRAGQKVTQWQGTRS